MVDFRGSFQKASDFLQEQDTGGVPQNPPLTETASSHAITIRTDKGIRVGRIQTWSTQLSRIIDTIYEVQQRAKGEPLERVAQIQNANRISVDRYELYLFHIGEAFGVPVPADQSGSSGIDLVNLTLQIKPFNVREIWRDPFGTIRAYLYVGCWFADLGTTIAANDDRIVKSRATLEFIRRLRLA